MIYNKQLKTKYNDNTGEYDTVINNTGSNLSVEIRGIVFSGSDFDALLPAGDTDPALLESFTLDENSVLCNCRLLCEIPIDLIQGHDTLSAILHMDLVLGNPRPHRRGIDEEALTLTLRYNNNAITSSGKSGFFENEMLDIQAQLSADTFMKCCFTCAYSDYHPAGNGLFGSLLCFKDNKEACLSVTDKSDLLGIIHTKTAIVQETHICADFEKRRPGTGYRG